MKPVTLILLLSVFSPLWLHGQNSTQIAKTYQKEIARLSKNKVMQSAFNAIEALEPQTNNDLIMLTEIPAPPFMESKRAQKFKAMLEQTGATRVWIDEAGNVLALKKGRSGQKTVALDAHIDTVFPIETDVKVKKKGDTLYAPGIGDDTRGLMVVLTVLRAMQQAGLQTEADLLFIGTVGEEGLGDLRGVRHLFEKPEIPIDAWISIDGGPMGRINNKALGSKRYKAIFSGPGGHSWGAFGLGNPAHAMAKAIDYFTGQASGFTAKGPKTSYNVGRIGGGTSVNSIPFEAWMEVDMRSDDPESLKQIDAIFRESVKSALNDYNRSGVEGPPVTLELEMIGDRPSGEIPPETPLVQRAMAVTGFFNVTPRLTRGSTNANIPISKGIPAVTLGRGGKGGGTHSLNEWWLNENGAEAIKLTLLLTVAEAGLSK